MDEFHKFIDGFGVVSYLLAWCELSSGKTLKVLLGTISVTKIKHGYCDGSPCQINVVQIVSRLS